MAQTNTATINLTGVDDSQALVAGQNLGQVGQRYLDPKTGNEYIYLPGVASLAQYDAVAFTHTSAGAYTVSRMTTSTKGQLAVAQAAINATTKYGWYLIAGAGTVNSSSATSGGALYAGSAGVLTSTSGANIGITGAHSTSATSSGTSGIFICTGGAYFSGI